MWIVLKYKSNEFNHLREDLKIKLGELPTIYKPKIKYQKIIRKKTLFIEQDILNDYLFCYHKKFENYKALNLLNNLKGLKYFLKGSFSDQDEIVHFINHCKLHQGKDGCLKQSFFDYSNIKKGKFLSGPFTNMIFEVIENQKNKLKVLIGNVTTAGSKNSSYLYRSI